MVLEHRVGVALLVECELVLEARATASLNAHPQARCGDIRALAGEELGTFSAPLSVIVIIALQKASKDGDADRFAADARA